MLTTHAFMAKLHLSVFRHILKNSVLQVVNDTILKKLLWLFNKDKQTKYAVLLDKQNVDHTIQGAKCETKVNEEMNTTVFYIFIFFVEKCDVNFGFPQPYESCSGLVAIICTA